MNEKHVPDFNRDRHEGQMNPEERAALYCDVMENQPRYCWEVGTCRGGGSTYFISTALENIDNGGKLITSETNLEWLEYARGLYRGALAHLAQRVMFNEGNSLVVYPKLLAQYPVDFCFIDGGESSMECVYQYTMFRPYMKVGSILALHDWDNGKTDYVRPLILNDQDWELITEAIAYRAFRRVSEVHK